MSVESSPGSESPLAGDSTIPILSLAERAILEAAGLPDTDTGKVAFDTDKTANFSVLLKDLVDFEQQPVGDAFALQRPITFEVNGERVELPAGNILVVGRVSKAVADPRPDVDLSGFNAEGLGVSRQHIRIVHAHGLIYVSDLGSINGTFLNTHPLIPGSRRILRDRDELRLGHLKIMVRFSTPIISIHAGR